ncbi:PBECR2 nuclease fold domain-containing protein [Ancylobacter lacus]|uniref:PBECR2 nuclease fold domain-containing protein n=1 Tax=Ancylobacter lacus TaxID=2579970 RepID=UPI001FE265CF|nr:PBECR2 nuclease fold domain-containing protein [Ancylobacter lacus]
MAVEPFRLDFAQATEFFRQKVNLPTQKWDDLRHGAHVRGFSVAGVTAADMLADFRAAMDKARSQGTSFQEFRRDFDAIVDRTGWTFNAVGSTEEQRRDWRARIIYNTNMRTSYMAGRYQQMTSPEVASYRPFWRYRHHDNAHPRPMHVAWDGTVLRRTDPWWKVHFPPNGWGCHCDVEAISERQLRAMGKTGPDPAPDDRSYTARDPRTGQPETRWPGIDRGWEYNVGEEWLSGVVPTELQKPLPPADTPPTDAPAPPPLPPPRPTQSPVLAKGLPDEDYARAFLAPFGASLDRGVLFRDASGGLITIDRSLFEARAPDGSVLGLKVNKRDRGPFMGQLAETILDPDEIWIDWVRVASGIVLRRAYIRSTVLPDGRTLFSRFEWTARGWTGITSFIGPGNYVGAMRTGALLFRRG